MLPSEVQAVITGAKQLKAPSLDGLKNDFYKLMEGEISVLELEEFPYIPNKVLTKILLKPGKNPVSPESYQPISLLNLDSKLLAKVLADHLAMIILNLIQDSQVRFVKCRNPAFNLWRILSFAIYCKIMTLPFCWPALMQRKLFLGLIRVISFCLWKKSFLWEFYLSSEAIVLRASVMENGLKRSKFPSAEGHETGMSTVSTALSNLTRITPSEDPRGAQY